jgi:hypothetical protein
LYINIYRPPSSSRCHQKQVVLNQYMYIYLHIYIYTYTYINVYLYIHTYIRTHIIHHRLLDVTKMWLFWINIHIFICTSIYDVYIYVYLYVYTHICRPPSSSRFHQKEVILNQYTQATKTFCAKLNISYIDIRSPFLAAIPFYRLGYKGIYIYVYMYVYVYIYVYVFIYIYIYIYIYSSL